MMFSRDARRVLHYDDGAAGDAGRFPQQNPGVVSVVQDEDEKSDVEGFIPVGQPITVEPAESRNPDGWRDHVTSIRHATEFFGKNLESVTGTTTDIDDARPRGQVLESMP
jgi:hypothetical protein